MYVAILCSSFHRSIFFSPCCRPHPLRLACRHSGALRGFPASKLSEGSSNARVNYYRITDLRRLFSYMYSTFIFSELSSLSTHVGNTHSLQEGEISLVIHQSDCCVKLSPLNDASLQVKYKSGSYFTGRLFQSSQITGTQFNFEKKMTRK